MKIRFLRFVSSPTNLFASAFATVALGFIMRFEPRFHQWLLTLISIGPETAIFIVRIIASIFMIGGSVFLFFATNKLRRSKQQGLLFQLMGRRKQK